MHPSKLRLIRKICKDFDVKPAEIKSGSERSDVVTARWACWYAFAKYYRTLTLQQIGRETIGRPVNHTTVLHGIHRHCELNGLPYPRPRRKHTPVSRLQHRTSAPRV